MSCISIALGAAAVFGGAGVATAAPCAPEATLDGDGDLVELVRAQLATLGDVVAAATVPPRCKRVAATVAHNGDAIAVGVEHGAQRDTREVQGPELAAAWIDSWLHDDELAPVFTRPPAPPQATPEIATVLEARAAIQPPQVARSHWDAISIGAAFEQQWTTDGTRWTGASAAACMRVGPACFGARVRFAEQAIAYAQTAAQRDDGSLFATASYAHAIGRMIVAPELGLGAGRGATARLDGCRTPGQSPAPNCTAPDGAPDALLVGDGFHVASYTPRGEATLRISVPLFDRVWLDGIASAALAPFGHADAYPLAPGRMPPAMTTGDQVALPGDPLASFQLGIGLRVGAP